MEELIERGKQFEAILLTHHHSDHVGAVNSSEPALSSFQFKPMKLCFKRIEQGYLQGAKLFNDGDRLDLGHGAGWQSCLASKSAAYTRACCRSSLFY